MRTFFEAERPLKNAKFMNRNRAIGALLVLATVATAIYSCNKKAFEPVEEVVFIQDARLEEEGLTRAPGDAIHLNGTGYQQTDNVMFTFTWETGDNMIPVGKASGIYAKKQETDSDGITAMLPYRYPAADVEVNVMREGKLQKIGSLKITDGQSPEELRLYGIDNAGKSIDGFILDVNNVGRKSLDIALPEYFHSVINAPRSFGLCGIAGEGNVKTAEYVDFFTGKAETLATYVIALVMTPANAVVAITGKDGVCTLLTLPIEVGADYMTKSDTPHPTQPTFTLPEGLRTECFGDYPGIFIGSAESCSYLLSANKGDGNWATVVLDKDGFRKVEDIEAAAVIPFRAGEDAGYIVTYEDGPSLFRPVNAKTGEMSQAIYTCKTGRILSATSNPQKPDHLLLNFSDAFNGTNIYDLDWNNLKTLSPIVLPNSVGDYAEALMAN